MLRAAEYMRIQVAFLDRYKSDLVDGDQQLHELARLNVALSSQVAGLHLTHTQTLVHTHTHTNMHSGCVCMYFFFNIHRGCTNSRDLTWLSPLSSCLSPFNIHTHHTQTPVCTFLYSYL